MIAMMTIPARAIHTLARLTVAQLTLARLKVVRLTLALTRSDTLARVALARLKEYVWPDYPD